MFEKYIPKSNLSFRDNLKWLYILRNLMIVAESLLILFSVYALNILLPEQQLWLVLSSICAVNLYTGLRLKTDEPVTELEVFSQICLDVLALGSLLYLTGGASNPIIWVFLLPIILTAIMLPHSYAWNMVILTCCLYTFLIAYNIPLPAIEPHASDPITLPPAMLANEDMVHYLHSMQDRHYFNLHMTGMWLGFVFSAGLVAFFVVELSKTIKARERSLADARENIMRDERVIALGTLAASAAHDMGTPLGTMAIVAHEMSLEYTEPEHVELLSQINIMKQQIERCNQALSVLSASAGEMRAESGKPMPMIKYIDEVMNQWRSHNTLNKLNLHISPTAVDVNAEIIAEQTLTHSLINILNNAAKVTPPDKGIDFSVDWNSKELMLKIRDYGPGFPEEIVEFIGKQPIANSKQGLGVGLFLTCSTINRLGGKIDFFNMESGGACVEIEIPLLITEINDENTGIGET